MAKFSDTPGTDLSYTIQPIGKATITLGKARGGNSLGIEAIEQTCESQNQAPRLSLSLFFRV